MGVANRNTHGTAIAIRGLSIVASIPQRATIAAIDMLPKIDHEDRVRATMLGVLNVSLIRFAGSRWYNSVLAGYPQRITGLVHKAITLRLKKRECACDYYRFQSCYASGC
jgi:hypothetical protein